MKRICENLQAADKYRAFEYFTLISKDILQSGEKETTRGAMHTAKFLWVKKI